MQVCKRAWTKCSWHWGQLPMQHLWRKTQTCYLRCQACTERASPLHRETFWSILQGQYRVSCVYVFKEYSIKCPDWLIKNLFASFLLFSWCLILLTASLPAISVEQRQCKCVKSNAISKISTMLTKGMQTKVKCRS